MAKEVDLKKIELKVSVNCCDGCKKKVKKVLRSIEGVLKTEIDPWQPKVTILGNVEPQTLIKKLMKAGKQAELWSKDNQSSAGKEKKEVEMAATREKENSKSGFGQAKCSGASANTNTNTNDQVKDQSAKGGDIGDTNKASKKETDCVSNTSTPEVTKKEKPLTAHPEAEVNCVIHPNMLHDMGKARTHTQTHEYCYMVEPYTITLPYYAIHSYTMPPLAPTSYSQELYHYERPIYQPPVQTPAAKVGDYFSDENTVGCHVM